MKIFNKFVNNCRKPEGFLGKVMLSSMNKGHAPLSKWGIGHIPERDFKTILDIGCGGGLNLKRFLAEYPKARVTGIDYSVASIEKSIRVNKADLRCKRLKLVKGDVAKMPFKEGRFELITAFETVYFWKGPVESFKEVYRVLDPKGMFIIINEVNEINEKSQKWMDIIDGMNIYNKEKLEEFLKEAGFKKISVAEEGRFLCVIAEK